MLLKKADIWSEAIKKIVKAITARRAVALGTAIAALLTLWPSGDSAPDPIPEPLLDKIPGMVHNVLSFTIQSSTRGLNPSGQCGNNLKEI